MTENKISYIDYLESKKEVDDRSLNQRVFALVRRELFSLQQERPVRILEIGAGTGTMLERLLEQGSLLHAHYTAVDLNADFLAHIPSRMEQLSAHLGWETLAGSADSIPTRVALRSEKRQVEIELIPDDIFEFIDHSQQQHRWDMVLAHAVLDLFPLPFALREIFTLLKPDGFYYFTLNYDGMTHLLPTMDEQFDGLIEQRYHHTMDGRKSDGRPIAGRSSGRQLLTQLPALHAPLLATGSSDWIVHPGEHGYSANTATFLRFMIKTIEEALRTDPEINQARFAEWIMTRYAQVNNHQLTLIAHQLDCFGRVRKS